MINVTAEELETILATVDGALDMHTRWCEQLQRTLICKLLPEEADMADDAHQHCAFGQWFYSPANAHLRKLPAFKHIEELHVGMHSHARELCIRVKGHWGITVKEYDPFIAQMGEFREQLQKLRQKVQETLHKIDSLTGAYAGHQLLPELRAEQEHLRASGKPYSLLLLRFDLIEINRSHGHKTGDGILRTSIGAVRQTLDPMEKVYRHRGTEFVICLPGKTQAQAEETREAILQAIDATLGSLQELAKTDLRVQYGVVALEPGALIEQLINQAALATYKIQI